jgi:hypothetical protein
MKKLKRMAAKETIRLAKEELIQIKKKGEKVNLEEFEEYVKFLYEETLKKMVKEHELKYRKKNR